MADVTEDVAGRDETEQGTPRRRQRGAQPPRDGNPVAEAQEAVVRAVDSAAVGVERERYPRRRLLRRGRALLVAYCVALAVVVALALAAHAVSVLPGDLPFTRELQETTVPGVAGLMTAVSYIGYPLQSAIILAVAVLVLLVLRMPVEALFLVLTLLADALGAAIKAVVARQRPSSSLVHVAQRIGSPSFPSGHTLHYTVFYGFLIFVVATHFRPSWGRTLALVLLALPIALVGLSRVYLGEHWASDVVGGYLLGALCLVPLIWGYLRFRGRFEITGRAPFVHRRRLA